MKYVLLGLLAVFLDESVVVDVVAQEEHTAHGHRLRPFAQRPQRVGYDEDTTRLYAGGNRVQQNGGGPAAEGIGGEPMAIVLRPAQGDEQRSRGKAPRIGADGFNDAGGTPRIHRLGSRGGNDVVCAPAHR